MKLKKFIINYDLNHALTSVFGDYRPYSLIEIAKKSKRSFPLFQASIGHGDDPRPPDKRLYFAKNRHLLTWFRTQEGVERAVSAHGHESVFTHYYMGLWYTYGWRRKDKELQAILAEMETLGEVRVASTWAWIVVERTSAFNIGAFNAIFRE